MSGTNSVNHARTKNTVPTVISRNALTKASFLSVSIVSPPRCLRFSGAQDFLIAIQTPVTIKPVPAAICIAAIIPTTNSLRIR